MHRVLFLLLPAAVIGFVVSGCGGSKESAGTTTRAAGFSTVEATTKAATTQTTAPATPSIPTTTATSTLATAKNCKDLADLSKQFSSAFSGAANSQNLKKQAELLKEFAERTPSDVRADFRLVADYLSKVADVAGGIKPGQTPSAATLAKLQKLGTQIDQAKLTAASAHISAWVQKNCAR